MTSVSDLLSELYALDIKLWVENNQLCYDSPPDALTQDLLSKIVKHKQEIIQILSDKKPDIKRLPPIVKMNEDENRVPLSFNQEQLWFFDQSNPGLSTYNIPGAIRINGHLDIGNLESSLNELIKRHEALRTIFPLVEGRSVQKILKPQTLTLPVEDLRHLQANERESAALKLAQVEAKRPFDLSQGPLFRPKLWILDDYAFILQITVHHIIADAWSMRVLMRELLKIYEIYHQRKKILLPEVKVQYKDFSLWQKKIMDQGILSNQLKYWKRELDSIPSLMNLPLDKPRPKTQSFMGGVKIFSPQKELYKELVDLSRNENITLFQTLMTAFQVLIYRYTAQSDSVIGFLFSNRSPETKDSIGFYVNTVPLRTNLSGNPSFRETLLKNREVFLKALKNSDIPFIKIVESLKAERKSSQHPIFQVLVAHESVQIEKSELLDLEFNYFLVDYEKSKFDLTLFITEGKGNFKVTLEYNSDIFNSSTIDRMLGHFEVLLKSIVKNPDLGISNLLILTEKEVQEILFKWNDTFVLYPLEKTLHEHFESQVEQTPNAIAVVSPSTIEKTKQLTYRELNSRANQLAYYLQNLGAGPEILVGIFMERSLEMVVELLGTLKSGAAYVPLDPEYPQERLSFMIEDSRVSILLTQKSLKSKLPQYKGKLICLDEDWGNIAQNLDTNPMSGATPENLAYVIYTSGSTGKPKGVMNTHQGICNRLLWMQDTFKLTKTDRVLQKTPFSFDVSIWEFFWPLISGAGLVMARPGGHRDSTYLVNIIHEQKITTLHFVPSMLRLFLEDEGIEKCSTYLKRVICSGEELPFALQKRFFDRFDAALLYNLYGPTEAAIDVTWWECKRDDSLRLIPIGKTIANTQIYILDSYLQPVPIGVPGELYIGGLNLARGYLNRPELTKQKFIRNPFSKDPNARLYKTGDQVRYLPDGNIEFLGRLDCQVKIRGYRIELEEIEATIRQHSAVDEVVVVAREDMPGTNILVAYIVAPQSPPSVSELRDFLKTKLPEYMVPTTFVMLDAIPLTPNGKVNRAALPIPVKDRPRLETVFVLPRTPVEKVLADIWASVLKLDQVGIHDKFFDLGGDSIRSLQIIYLAKEKGLSFSLQDIFQNQTIYELSRVLKTEVEDFTHSQQTSLFSLVAEVDWLKLPRGLKDAYPLSMLQRGLVFHSEQSPEYAVYVTSYHLRALFDHQLLQMALDELVARHPMLRTSFDFARFSEPLQLVHQSVSVSIKIEDLRNLSESQQTEVLSKWINAEKKIKFNWKHVPLFRFYVHLRTEESFQFTIVEPFLDGWSVALLATELFSNYQALLRGEKLSKDSILSFYRDYVALEREALRSQKFREFWTQKLDNSTKTMLPKWPLDLNKPQLLRKQVVIPQHVNEGLKKVAQSLSVPLKSVLLAAHLRVISLLSGQTRVLTGLMSNGRPETREGEKIIGLFLNVLPLNFELLSGTWEDLMKETFKAEAELLPFRRYPLAQIQLDNGGPLFDTVFNFIHFYPYQDFLGTEVELLDIKANDQTYFSLTAQFSIDWLTSDIRLSLDYNANEFCEKQIENIAGYYVRAFTQIAESPQEHYLSQSLLSEQEKYKLFSEWNNTNKDLPKGKCFHQLFEEQVKYAPDVIAIVDDETQLTYRELNSQADRMARSLVEQGVGSDFVVTLLANRGINFLVSILAIFKAGGAYLPLHPDWPPYRIRQILDQSKSKMIITLNEFLPAIEDSLKDLAKENRPLVIELTELLRKDRCETNLPLQYSSKNLAYVIYTSGSTGIPKGAMIEHKGMLNNLYAKIEDLQLDKDCVIAQTASQSFDISVWQFLASLLVGGRVEVAGNDIIQDPVRLVQFIERKEINIFETVPSLLRVILEEITTSRISASSLISLKRLLVTGEAFPIDLCQQWLSIYPQIPVVNAYGPTECSDDVTHCIVKSLPLESITTVPIGRPIRNTKIYILDQNLKPVPVGVPGELFVGGIGIGRGYLNDATRTSKSFISNIFTQRSSSTRLYKTGDLARFLPDGNIEFLGRIDHQVKIRGFRVEIGEIESVLRQHQAIKDAVVVMRMVADKEELVAYVVFESDIYVNPNEIRIFLRQQLPEYMVPSVFVQLQALPINQNGKVDRQALPEPDQTRPDLGVVFVSPRTQVEEVLTKIWEQVLGIEQVGIYDNFFDLGGHSLQAIQLASKMSMAINRDISVGFLLLHPSVAAIAGVLEELTPIGRKALEPDSNSATVTQKEISVPKSFSFLKFEKRSLLKLITTGKLKPIDAAAFGYLPSSLLRVTKLSRDEIIHGWFDNLPNIRSIFTTSLGRICHITLPRFSTELYRDQENLLNVIVDGLELAGRLGARTVSLTGLIPSATNYGRAIVAKISGRGNLPKITTGHATTTTAVIFSIEKILSESGRNLSEERLGFLGMGSIGLATLRLMLSLLPHPLEINLCDVYSKHDLLKKVRQEIIYEFGFQGSVNIFFSPAKVSPDFYRSTLIVGATNLPDILDIAKIRPGTIIVDDSAPHCFNPELAIQRLENQEDILFTEGGILKSSQPISELRYLPDSEDNANPFKAMINYRHSDYELMGCIFSSLLPSVFNDVAPILGLVDIDTCIKRYKKLSQLEYMGADMCCKEYLLPDRIIKSFRQRFGSKN